MRAAFERRLGARVVEAVTQPSGFSPGLAARVRLEDGRRAFLKAVAEEANPDTPDIHRREARILAAMPPTAPIAQLLWSYDEMGWVALCLEDVDGRHPDEPWTEGDLRLVVATLTKMAADLTPSPIAVDQSAAGAFATNINGWRLALERNETRLDQWCLHNLERLAQLESIAPAAAEGDTLLNFDVRADNLLIAGDRLFVLDWPWARNGAWWIDLLLMAPSVAMQGGPQPEQFLTRLDLRGVTPAAIDAVVASLAGYFVVRALEPPPQGIPTVREFQAAQGRVAISWLRERLGWD